MGQVTHTYNLTNIHSLPDLIRYLTPMLNDIVTQLNGNIVLNSNITSTGPYTVTFKGSTDVQTINHNLGMVPTGTIEVFRTAAIVPYSPSAVQYTWTSSQIFLQSNGAGSVTIYLI